MYRFTIISCIAAALLVVCPQARAWNGTGHMTVAAIAWHQLPETTRLRLVEMLKEHPWYRQWLDKMWPQGDENLNLFMMASTWPDDIRGRAVTFELRERWHYVNYPLIPKKFTFKGSPSPKDDILYGIGQCEARVSDGTNDPKERAEYLSWLLHLVGDIHQPLHCATWIGAGFKAPEGDRGGNTLYVRAGEGAVRLHAYWDALPGNTGNMVMIEQEARGLEKEFPRAALQELARGTPLVWSRESRDAAIRYVYLRGALAFSRTKKAAPLLTGKYRSDAEVLARRRIVLAGYRLADLLQRLLGK